MEFQNEVMTLTRLGLTSSQAIVYLTLARLGTADAQTISNYSHVGRSDIYRTMTVLKNLGLAEKIISTPCKFKAITSKDSLAVLLKRKMDEVSELQGLTREILKHVEKNDMRTEFEEYEEQFILMSEQVGDQQRSKALETAQKSFDLLVPWQRYLQKTSSLPREDFHRFLRRKIECRILVDKPSDNKNAKLLSNSIKQFKKSPNFNISHLPSPLKTTMLIIDKKYAWIFCGYKKGQNEGRDLYINNVCLLSILNNYYENLWKIANEDEKRQRLKVSMGTL